MFKSVIVVCVMVLCAVPVLADNPFGRALVLNGDGQYFQVPDSTCADLANMDVFSLEIRVKMDEAHGFNLFNKLRYYGQIHEYSRPSFRSHGWFVDINRTSTRFEEKLLISHLNPLDAFYYGDCMRITRTHGDATGGGMSRSGQSGFGISSGQWHHFVLIFSEGEKKFYVDGVSSGSGSSSPVDNAVTGYPLNVGGFTNAIDTTLDLSSYLKGQIDEFRIWNKVLTSQEINAMMNDTLSAAIYTSPESGLIGYYRFEELENLGIGNDGLANDVRDLSVNANHGNVWNSGVLTDQAKMADRYDIPVTFQYYENSTRSFEPSTEIDFELPEASPVDIKVYDIHGRLVSMLTEDLMDVGLHSFEWASPKLPNGVYICKMASNSFNKTFKIVLQQ